MGELLTGHVKTDENPSDLLSKVVGGGQKRKNLVQMYLYDIHDGRFEGIGGSTVLLNMA